MICTPEILLMYKVEVAKFICQWLWKHGFSVWTCKAATPEQPVLLCKYTVMRFKYSQIWFTGLLHNTPGEHSLYSLPPLSHTHCSAQVCYAHTDMHTHAPSQTHTETHSHTCEGTPESITSADWKQNIPAVCSQVEKESWFWLSTDDVYSIFSWKKKVVMCKEYWVVMRPLCIALRTHTWTLHIKIR